MANERMNRRQFIRNTAALAAGAALAPKPSARSMTPTAADSIALGRRASGSAGWASGGQQQRAGSAQPGS